MRRADTLLFTGAGFSRGARNLRDEPMPVGADLARLLWPLCYPSEPFDEVSKLEDLFDNARSRNVRALADLLHRALSVQPRSIPEYYAKLLSMPWYRVYTLNVDDLAIATARVFSLGRRIVPLSAVSWANRQPPTATSDSLEVIHLNGVLEDGPDRVTFSPTQYAERLAGQEPLYAQCAAEVLVRPVVFIGTPLNESPLWQHLKLRKQGTRTRREFRRQSFIVTPTLDRARRDLLEREFHVKHLPMSVEEFTQELIATSKGVVEEGMAVLRTSVLTSSPRTEIPLAFDLSAASQAGQSDFLLGRTPTWGDIRDGVAAARECNVELRRLVASELAAAALERRTILLTGTAGAGKTTAAMQLALELGASGTKVGWIDASIDISPVHLRRCASSDEAPSVLIIDEAERYGSELPAIVQDLALSTKAPVVIVAIRAGRGADRFQDRADMQGIRLVDYVMPNLADSDIEQLLSTLARHHRLGVLKGRAHSERIKAFKDVAGRQLIVALLEATSGRRFEELIISELEETSDDTRTLYSLVAVATALRFGLTKEELLLSVGDSSNATLGAIDSLQRKFLISTDPSGELRVRHRVIADVLMKYLSAEGGLGGLVIGLAVAAATKVSPVTPYQHKHARRLRSLINHDWLFTQVGEKATRQLYDELESLTHHLHHYWLQRGSFELEHGDLQLAENFLNQAYSLEPHDALVMTEYGYLRLRMAVAEPGSAQSRIFLSEGMDLLDRAIHARRSSDPHQFHIVGKMGLAWMRRGDVSAAERQSLLNDITSRVEAGRAAHPRNELVREIYVAIQNERLGIDA